MVAQHLLNQQVYGKEWSFGGTDDDETGTDRLGFVCVLPSDD